MNTRTDLISELKSGFPEISGTETKTKIIGNAELCTTEITTESAAEKLQKPKGKYCTVSFERLDRIPDTKDIVSALIAALRELVGDPPESTLIVGLGNTDITPDALGPFVADSVIATRHLSRNLRHTLGLDGLKTVSCLIPGVLGKTGIESQDIVSAAAAETKPELIIAIDALAARDPERLCSTIQLSNTGITPGSGVNNARKELSKEKLHIPVVAIGMPTVTDAGSRSTDNRADMMVTPKEIDLLIKKGSEVIAKALNMFLQPSLDEETIESIT